MADNGTRCYSAKMILNRIFAVGLLGLTIAGCCTQEGCEESFVVHFSESLPPGPYTATVIADGKEGICSGQFGVEGEYPTCSGMSGLRFESDSVSLNGEPERIEITLESESGVIAHEIYEPDYETEYPNGKSCGPECKTAEDSLQIDLE